MLVALLQLLGNAFVRQSDFVFCENIFAIFHFIFLIAQTKQQ